MTRSTVGSARGLERLKDSPRCGRGIHTVPSILPDAFRVTINAACRTRYELAERSPYDDCMSSICGTHQAHIRASNQSSLRPLADSPLQKPPKFQSNDQTISHGQPNSGCTSLVARYLSPPRARCPSSDAQCLHPERPRREPCSQASRRSRWRAAAPPA